MKTTPHSLPIPLATMFAMLIIVALALISCTAEIEPAETILEQLRQNSSSSSDTGDSSSSVDGASSSSVGDASSSSVGDDSSSSAGGVSSSSVGDDSSSSAGGDSSSSVGGISSSSVASSNVWCIMNLDGSCQSIPPIACNMLGTPVEICP